MFKFKAQLCSASYTVQGSLLLIKLCRCNKLKFNKTELKVYIQTIVMQTGNLGLYTTILILFFLQL